MLPSTFRAIQQGRYIRLVRAEYEQDLLAQRSDTDCEIHSRGRGAIRALPLGESGDRMLLRQCRRGGVLARAVGDVYLGYGRAVNEIRVSECARDKGVPTALVLGATCERVLGPLFRMEVITKEIPNSCDLIHYLEAPRDRALYPPRRRLIDAVAGAIRKMHDAGVYHADLHLKNLLIDAEGAAYILDLDRARVVQSVGTGLRMANLLRLDRSVRKWEACRQAVTTADRLRFLRAYAGDDRRLLAACLRLFRRRRTYPVHRLFWKLMGIT